MKFGKIIFLTFVGALILIVSDADPFDEQPKILVNDGNLVFQSADSKNVSIKLNGKSKFLVNDVDVLKFLSPKNTSTSDSSSNTDSVSSLKTQFSKLKKAIRGQNGILKRLEDLESSAVINGTRISTTDRSRLNALNRRIFLLEQTVANLTERLMRDHCKSYPCQHGGTCFNMFDTFRCECTENWDGPTCSEDVNECSKYVGTDLGCQNGATCINTPGSYQCSCTEGWKGTNCNRKKVDCLSVPQSEICGQGTCVSANNKDGYECICKQGWRKANDSQACTQDVDECTEMRPHCSVDPKVFCINTPGSFVCGPCPSGWTGNGFHCEDIDECEFNNGGCSNSPKVACINSRGSYHCGNCPVGYEGDGRVCVPGSSLPNSLECSDSSICNANARCYQYVTGVPTCVCRPGYSGNGYGENGCTAVQMDPCTNLRCRNGGTCVRNDTTAFCQCPRGTGGALCDITNNPCNPNPCQNNGNCTRFGMFSYRCNCLKGFTGTNCQSQSTACGRVLYLESGILKYPENSTVKYPHNSRCAWLIKTNHTKVLNVTFTKFNLETSKDCKFDWLQIHDGRSSASQLIGRFCGNILPKGGSIISTHNLLYFWFRSDNSTSHDGFELSWESIDPVCGGELNITTHGTLSSPGSPGKYPMNRDCEWFITAPPNKRIQFLFYTLMIEAHETCGYDYVEIHSGLGIETSSLGKYCNTTSPPPLLTPSHTATVHFHSDGESSDDGFQIAFSVVEGIPGCGGTFTAPRGDIMSPTSISDGNYKHNIACDYIIQMPKNTRVRIEFKKFALEDSLGCKFDKLEIYEGNGENEELLMGRYCGEAKPPTITSQTNVVLVKFITDWSTNDEGFQFQYNLVCGGIYADDNGVISSPDYPQSYERDRNCEYDIQAPLNKIIVLQILDLDMESHSSCDFDYLEIFDSFESDNIESVGKFCGKNIPETIVSSFNHLHIVFNSDASITGRGFQANYSFSDVECGGIIRNASDIIKSPLDTDGNGVYKSNVACRWLIVAPKGHVIQMNFLTFDLEYDTQCKYDYVKIFNNGTGNGDEVGPFCGTNVPKLITSSDNIATVIFRTDTSTAREGFTISLSFVDATKLCGANYFNTHGFIRSPGTPEYLPNKECEWTITVPNGQQIEIKFTYFEMESHVTCRFDGLDIRNGGNSFAPLVGKFCGDTIPPPVKSFGNQMYIRFYSDSSRSGRGFELEWDGTSTGCGGVLTSPKGSISSPNYPKSYANNAQCEWRISVNEGSTIQIIFTDLDLENHAECNYDYLEIFDGSDASTTSFGRFCSSESHPMHIETTGNHALIRMSSDDSHGGRGFFLKYSINCNRTILNGEGIVESPNFPDDYPNRLDCSWIIAVTRGNRLNMQFSHFYLENSNRFHNETNEHICDYDYLEISDFDFETKKETQQKSKYCNHAPEIRNSTSNAVKLIFHTDASATGSGFRMEWYTEGCGGKLTHDNGTITSPNYPRKYTDELHCEWEINVQFGTKIELTINDLDMEDSLNCNYDQLIIANDRDFNSSIAKICQSQHDPRVLTSSSHKLFILFQSDGSRNGRGFNISYRSIKSDCGGIFIGTNGIITSPNYPKNYGANKNCEWKIQTDPSHSVLFELIDFDFERSSNCTKDSLEIYDSILNKSLWKGCNNMLPNQTIFKSGRNELIIKMISDDSTEAKGFKGNISIDCGSRIVTNDSGELRYNARFENNICVWTIISDDPAKHVTATFTYINTQLMYAPDSLECLADFEIFDGDSILAPLRTSFCAFKTVPSIISNGNALTIKLNISSSSLKLTSGFGIHYTVLDNACGGTYGMSLGGEFASPKYPNSSPLNTYCIWSISASNGNKIALSIKNLKLALSYNCNDNYLEVREESSNGRLVDLFCGNKSSETKDYRIINPAQKFWIKYKTDSTSSNLGFLASYQYSSHCELGGTEGILESPLYPQFLYAYTETSYRITVGQGSIIRIEFAEFYINEDDPEDCASFVKFYNGYDVSAPVLQDELCSDSPEPIVSETNVVYIEFVNNHLAKSKFKIVWQEASKIIDISTSNDCSNKIITLMNETDMVNITSPGYPYGYANVLDCSWIINSGIPSYHPVITFDDIDLEDIPDCVTDYVSVHSDRDDGTWKKLRQLCSSNIHQRPTFEGTPNLKVVFKTDYGINQTGFSARTYLECGGYMKEPDGIIEYNFTRQMQNKPFLIPSMDCVWNITVKRGRTIKFEFLSINIRNTSQSCDSFITIRNGIDDASPYLGRGHYCGTTVPDVPQSSSNRAFVKFKSDFSVINTFKLRYYEVQKECGGQVKLNSQFKSIIIASPNYPNVPDPHIECLWTVIGPIGEQIRVDFIENFDLSVTEYCDTEYVELRDGSTSSAQLIGLFCNEKPTTKHSTSNILRLKYFTDVAFPKSGFKANFSIGSCGGITRSNDGFLTSPKYPGKGSYPNNAECEFRIIGPGNNILNITIMDLDLPPSNGSTCDRKRDHMTIFSIIKDVNNTASENFIELGTYCGNVVPSASLISDTNEIVVKLITFQKTRELYKGFQLHYIASKLNCGGNIDAASGVITSPGYPSQTLGKAFCEWKITVPKGKRVKIEFLDVDLISSLNQFLQRIGVYNDFKYSNRLKFITNNTLSAPLYSSDNRIMVTLWVRMPSQNRGFKLRFSSDNDTICVGNLNRESGEINAPFEENLRIYTCEYIRDVTPISGTSLKRGTLAIHFTNLSVGKKISNCRYASTVINVIRTSGNDDSEKYLSRICGNLTTNIDVLSPFPDTRIEIKQSPFFGAINFNLKYKTHNCGGILTTGQTNYIKNPEGDFNSDALDCAWFVKYEDGFNVAVTITKLQLTRECDEEFIIIYNGATAISPQISKLCKGGANNENETLLSQKSSVFIVYHTKVYNSNSVFELKTDSAAFGCGGILNKLNYAIKLPSVGSTYLPNMECIWEIRADPGYHVGLTFTGRFFIEDSVNCTKDYLEVFNYVDEEWVSLGKKCGRELPVPYNSTGQRLKLIFRSDDATDGDGFNAIWTQNCGGIFKVDDKTRILSSPGYPMAYGSSLYCNYTLVSDVPEAFININFLDFEVETTGNKCIYDNVTIYKQSEYMYPKSQEKIGTFCGTKSPGKYRHKNKMTIIFITDRWVERKGFQIEYKLDKCGGTILNSTMISSPKNIQSTMYIGPLYCTWNITAPSDKKIVVKFEEFSMEHSDYCSFDYVEIFNGTTFSDDTRLAKVCGNLTNIIKPIVIENNRAALRLKTDQTSNFVGFSAAILFQPKCDQKIILSKSKHSYLLDKSSLNYSEQMECIYTVQSDPLTTISLEFNEIHLSVCEPERHKTYCACDFVEILDGNGPFSEVIGRYCGHDIPAGQIVSTRSALYIRFVTDSQIFSTGFKATIRMIESPCGDLPYRNFTENSTDITHYISMPTSNQASTYSPNLRCLWVIEAPYGKYFEIQFTKFELESSDNCVNDQLSIEDDSVKEFITEGLGGEIIFRGKSSSSYLPSFYMGVSGPVAPHVYCGSELPHDYISQTSKIKIKFQSNSANEYSGFNLTLKVLRACARNYTSLQGRLMSADSPEDCQTSIKVPKNYTISLYFIKFFFYDTDCTKSYMKVYDGDFDNGALMGSFCGYTVPSPIFSSGNELTIVFKFSSEIFYSRGSYDLMYVATNNSQGCGGEIYNYGGTFSSPLYPSSNRTRYDCTWTVAVPQNLKVALKFSVFDMGTKLTCASDYVEFLEENENGIETSIRKYCGDDDPAAYVSGNSKIKVHFIQTVNFAGTGWMINFMGVTPGAKPQNW